MPYESFFPDLQAKADATALRQTMLAQQMMNTQNMQREQQAREQTAQKASEFGAMMQQLPATASFTDRISAAADAAVKTGAYDQADKIIGVWSKSAEQQAKALKEGEDAAAKHLDNTRKQWAGINDALSGVTSQEDLNERDRLYTQQNGGQHLPMQLRVFQPGMDKRLAAMTTTESQKAENALKAAQALKDKIESEAKQKLTEAQVATERAKADEARAKAEEARKHGGLYASQAKAVDEGKGKDGTGGKGGAKESAMNSRFASRQHGAFLHAAQHIDNLSDMPIGSGLGTFSDLATRYNKTGADAIGSLAARKVTEPAARAFQQQAAMMETELGILSASGQGGGTTASMVKELHTMRPQAGDPETSMALYLALVKQALQVQSQEFDKYPGATEPQRDEVRARLRDLEQKVPWSVSDVNKHLRGDKKTLADKFSEKFLGAGGESKPKPTAADIEYVKKHPEHKDAFKAHFGVDP